MGEGTKYIMKGLLRIDFWLLVPAIILVLISLTTLLSINPIFFRSQLFALIIGLAAFWFFSRMNIEFLRQLRTPIYIVSIILLLIVLGIGIESRGAVRWISIFGVQFQFSEILKPFLVVCFASLLADRHSPTIKSFFGILLLLSPVIFLIYLQPDLGNAILFAFVAFFVLITYGFPLVWFLIGLLPLVLVSPIIWTMLHQYQRQRLLTFLHPSADPLGASYNSIQAIIAVGSGTFFGRGLSQGTQSVLRFLPERHTDFIFSTIAEGLGFIGSMLVVLAFLFLCFRIYLIFRRTNGQFGKLLAVSCFAFFLIQGFMNIGMNIGYLPIVGVTLPFVSFGGSSLLANFIFLGILSSLSLSHKHKDVLEIR